MKLDFKKKLGLLTAIAVTVPVNVMASEEVEKVLDGDIEIDEIEDIPSPLLRNSTYMSSSQRTNILNAHNNRVRNAVSFGGGRHRLLHNSSSTHFEYTELPSYADLRDGGLLTDDNNRIYLTNNGSINVKRGTNVDFTKYIGRTKKLTITNYSKSSNGNQSAPYGYFFNNPAKYYKVTEYKPGDYMFGYNFYDDNVDIKIDTSNFNKNANGNYKVYYRIYHRETKISRTLTLNVNVSSNATTTPPTISKTTRYATSGNVNIRTGPSTSYASIGKTTKGQKFVGTVEGNWFKTTLNGRTVYVSNKYLSSQPQSGGSTGGSTGSNTGGSTQTNSDTYKVNKTINGYYTANDAKNKTNSKMKVTAGNYYIFTKHDGMLNVTSTKGSAGAWINPSENEGTTPPPTQPKPPTVNKINKYATSGNVNIRSGPSTKYSILGKTTKGQLFNGSGDGTWFETTYNGKKAYVSNKYLSTTKPTTPKPPTVTNETREINFSVVNVRSGPGTGYSLLGQTYKGVKFTGVKEGTWFKTTFNGKTAYISYDLLDPVNTSTSKPPTPPVEKTVTRYATHNNVNIRQGSKTGTPIAMTTKGQEFKGVVDGAWFRTTFNGKTVYISTSYLTSTKPVNKEVMYVNVNAMNVRGGPGTNYAILGRATKGMRLEGTKEGKWFKSTLNGKTAYYSYGFLSETRPNTSVKPNGPIDVNKNLEVREVNYDVVNVRSGKSTNTNIVGQVKKGDLIIGEREGSWFKTTYNGKVSYISNSLLDKSNKQITRTVNNPGKILNFRSGPSLKHKRVFTVAHNGRLIGHMENGWFKTIIRDKVVYASTKLLK